MVGVGMLGVSLHARRGIATAKSGISPAESACSEKHSVSGTRRDQHAWRMISLVEYHMATSTE